MKSVIDHYITLHKIPEPSGKEYLTKQYLIDELKNIGYTAVCVGETGVYADLIIDKSLPYVLFRADMDALPITENSIVKYPSRHNGYMHACGHDSHCAMLLSAASTLYSKQVPQNIRFLFQPSEENTSGASEVIKNGALPQNLLSCFAIHVWPGVEKGRFATRVGALMASSDIFKIKIYGKSIHCSQYAQGADALRTASEIVTEMPNIKAQASNDNCILFCGSIHSGASHNIVADYAEVLGTIRTFSEIDRALLKDVLKKKSDEISNKHNTRVEFVWDDGCLAVDNDKTAVQHLLKIIPELSVDAKPTLAGEDFARYLEHSSGALVWIGTGNTPPLHNEAFYVPEDIMQTGVDFWLKIAEYDFKTEI